MTLKNSTPVEFYRQLSQVGIDKNTPEYLRKYVLLGNNINLTTLTLIVPYTFLFYFLGLPKLAILLGCLFFLFSFYHYLTFKRRYFLSRTLMLASMNLALGVYSVVLGKNTGLHFLYVVFFTLPFLLFDLKNYMLIAICCSSSITFFFFVRYAGVGPFIEVTAMAQKIISGITALVAFAWLLLNKLYLIKANALTEDTLVQTNQILKSRNRDLEQFAYVASHDLQEPLRTVASYVELLDKQYHHNFDDTGRKYMGYVLQSTYRLKNLIKDLLDYSRVGHNYKSEKIDMNSLAKEVIGDVQLLINETNADITVSVLPEVDGYSTDIKLLLQNLIVNAIKFKRSELTPIVKIYGEQTDDFIKFAVSDNGIGIAPQYRERIFVIFQRLHNQSEYEGNGIGLAHCKKIIEMHGGTIWVESEPEKGSTFFFTLPV